MDDTQPAPLADVLLQAREAFPRLYSQRIEPILQACEAERQAAIRLLWQRGLAGLGVASALLLLVLFLTGDKVLAVVAGIFVLTAAGVWAVAPAHAVRLAAKKKMLGAIAQAVSCSYDLDGFTPDGLDTLRDLALLPQGDRSSFEDRFSGTHHGCGFAFHEAHVQRKTKSRRRTRWVTVFRGVVISIEFPKPFLGLTVVGRDAGVLNFLHRPADNLQRVGFGEQRLEDAFEVYASDQVEARALIHPVFMERLLALEAQFKGRHLRGVFTKGHFLAVVEGDNKFELGSAFVSFLDQGRVEEVLGDIVEIMQLVDAVLTAERGALPAR